MNVTRKDVLRIAELANLELTETEMETYGSQLGSILSFCEKLNELDTANVEPLAQVLEAGAPANSRAGSGAFEDAQHLRPDAARDAAVIAEVVDRAPEGVTGPVPYFRVPKVIDR